MACAFTRHLGGSVARLRCDRTGLSHSELLLVLALTAVTILLSIPAIRYAREHSNRNLCHGNLKQFATIFAMYSKEDRLVRYPPMMLLENPAGSERYTIGLMPEPAVLYPEYCTDATIFFCPTTAPQARAAAKKASNFVEFLGTDLARQNTYVYFGHVFDHADNSMGWLVPMKTIQEALDYLELPRPPDDELIPAQAAAWLLQLVEDIQLKHPVVRMSDIDFLPYALEHGEWNILMSLLQKSIARQKSIAYESHKKRAYSPADNHVDYSVKTFLKVIGYAPPTHRFKYLGNSASSSQYRLNESIGQFLYVAGYTWKSPSVLPRTYILFETIDNSKRFFKPQFRSSVLYMDGHIESRELSLRVPLELQVDRGFDFDEHYTYPANDPINAPQPINLPMMNFIRAVRGWSSESGS